VAQECNVNLNVERKLTDVTLDPHIKHYTRCSCKRENQFVQIRLYFMKILPNGAVIYKRTLSYNLAYPP